MEYQYPVRSFLGLRPSRQLWEALGLQHSSCALVLKQRNSFNSSGIVESSMLHSRNAIVPTRFIVTTAHLTAVIMCFLRMVAAGRRNCINSFSILTTHSPLCRIVILCQALH